MPSVGVDIEPHCLPPYPGFLDQIRTASDPAILLLRVPTSHHLTSTALALPVAESALSMVMVILLPVEENACSNEATAGINVVARG